MQFAENAGTEPSGEPEKAAFDDHAERYDEEINQGLSLTGEPRDFFAEGRIKWLRSRLARIGCRPQRVLDFGCGTGGSVPLFFDHLNAGSVVGIDPSARSLAVARRTAGGSRDARFHLTADHQPDGSFDLGFCNGVFHHIPVPERRAAVLLVAGSLRSGGIFALCENNPWNPATRWMMNRLGFDRDAVLVWPTQARRMLREAGFEILSTDFLFIFPRALRGLRPVEPLFCKLPLGGQYMVLCRKVTAA